MKWQRDRAACAAVLALLVIGLPVRCDAGPAERAGELLTTPDAIVAAAREAKPGQVLLMRDGVWQDADILFEAEGTEGQPLTLRAQTPGKVILSGRSRLRLAGRHLVVDGLCFRDGWVEGQVIAFRRDTSKLADHCRLTNTAIIDYNLPDKTTDSKWVGLYGSHNRVDHCLLTGKTNAGTTLVVWLSDQPNEHRIDHNHFGPRPPLGANGGETIRIGTSDRATVNSRTVVESNYFEGCSGESEIISDKSCENVHRFNTFVACGGALTLRHASRARVEGNFFLGRGVKGTGGVRVIGEDHRVINNYFGQLRGDKGRAAVSLMNGIPNSPADGYYQVRRALIAFNTFVECRQSLLVGLEASEEQSLAPTDCVVANNLVVARDDPLVELTAQPVSMRWLGNILFGAKWGISPIAGISRLDPKLQEAPDGLWRPAAGSPALGAAEGDFPEVTDDIDGQPRLGSKDVGCDQASGAPVARRPLSPEDVGPAWMKAAAAASGD